MIVTPEEMTELLEEHKNLKSELETLAKFASLTTYTRQVKVELIDHVGDSFDNCIVGVTLDQIIEIMRDNLAHCTTHLQSARVTIGD